MTEPAAIVCRGLTFGFDHESIFEDLSLEVPEKSFFAILGRSGYGKTTFLRLLAGALKPKRGELLVHGLSPEQARAQHVLSICPQAPSLLPWMSVRANVEFAFRMWGKEPDRSLVAWALESVGLEDASEKRPAQLSGGMRSRVALARAWVAPGAAVLLMDESFSALDEISRSELSELLEKMWKQKQRTIVYVTHIVPEAIALATHIWVLAPAERKGCVEPLPISAEQRLSQRSSGKTALHEVILNALSEQEAASSSAGGVRNARPRLVAKEEVPSIVKLIADHHLSLRLRLNLVRHLEPHLLAPRSMVSLSPGERSSLRTVLDAAWPSATPEVRDNIALAMVGAAEDASGAGTYLEWILHPSRFDHFAESREALLQELAARGLKLEKGMGKSRLDAFLQRLFES